MSLDDREYYREELRRKLGFRADPAPWSAASLVDLVIAETERQRRARWPWGAIAIGAALAAVPWLWGYLALWQF